MGLRDGFPASLRRAASAAALAVAIAAAGGPGAATAAPIVFTSGTPEQTEVFRADLSGLGPGSLDVVTIQDANALGGATGRFSGFDLDAILLSRVLITSASQLAGLVAEGGFDVAGAVLSPGTQRLPASPPRPPFGSTAGGTRVDGAVATLGSFDGVPTDLPEAFGFVSLGDGGSLTLRLLTPVAIGPAPLYLYIGETGGGERAVGVVGVPEPASYALFGLALAGLGLARRRRGGGAARRG